MTEEGGIKARDISFPSYRSMIVRSRSENGSNQLLHVVFDRDGINGIDIDADLFALSEDGKYLLVSTGNQLSLIDFPNNTLIDEMSYEKDSKIERIQWITTTLAAVLLSHEMYLFDVNNRSEMFLISPIDDSVPVESVVGVYIDFTVGCYVLQADDGQLGKIQLGMFNSKPIVLTGQAACLCCLNCLSIKGLVALTVSVYEKEPNALIFRVTPMDPQLRYHFRTSLIRIPGLSSENRPDYIIPDPKHGLATIVFHNGFIHIWDILNQELTLSSFIYPRPVIASCFAPPAGFIVCFEEEPIMYRIDLDNLGFVLSVYNDGKVELALHLAVRLGLRDTKDPQFQTLIGSLARKDKRELQEAISAYVDADTFQYPQFIAKRFITDCNHLSDFGEFLFGIWRSERSIQWKVRIQNYLRNFDGPAEDDSSRDALSARSSAVISDTSDFDVLPMDRTVSHGLRESVRLTSTRMAQNMAQKVRQMAGIETVTEEAENGGEEREEEVPEKGEETVKSEMAKNGEEIDEAERGGKLSPQDVEAVATIAAVLRLAQMSYRRGLLTECVRAIFPEALRQDAEAAVAQVVELEEKPREREPLKKSQKEKMETKMKMKEAIDPKVPDNELTRRVLSGDLVYPSDEFDKLLEETYPNRKERGVFRMLYKSMIKNRPNGKV